MMKAWSYWATLVVCVLNLLAGAPGAVAGATAGIHVLNAVLEVVALLIIRAGNASLLPTGFDNCSPTFARTVSPVSRIEFGGSPVAMLTRSRNSTRYCAESEIVNGSGGSEDHLLPPPPGLVLANLRTPEGQAAPFDVISQQEAEAERATHCSRKL